MISSLLRKFTCLFLSLAMLISPTAFAGQTPSGQVPLITFEDLTQTDTAQRDSQLAKVRTYLSSENVATTLQTLGVTQEDAYRRVSGLSDGELAQLARDIDNAPAGGIVGAIVFVFLVLLLTDILGFTKVYPFTRSIRR